MGLLTKLRKRQKQSSTIDYEDVLKFDQLKSLMRKRTLLQGFVEGKITFPPTFKYDIGTDRWDSSSKQRCPAWTDRILFQQQLSTDIVKDPATSTRKDESNISKPMLTLRKYTSVQGCRHSDHRPVVATFVLRL